MAEEDFDELEEGEVEAADESSEKGSRKKLFLIIGGVVGLLLLIGTPLVIFSLGGDEEKVELDQPVSIAAEDELYPEGYDDEDEYDEDEEPLGALFPMETFVVNLAGREGYIRCQMQVEFYGRDVPRRFYSKLVPVRDGVIRILTSRSAEEVSNLEGKEALKQDVKQSINDLLRKEVVKNIYFTQFVLQ